MSLDLAQGRRTKIARMGYLEFGTAAAAAPRIEAMRLSHHELGYVEGKNIIIEFRWAERIDELRELAGELSRLGVDIIFATSSTEVEAVQQATKTWSARGLPSCGAIVGSFWLFCSSPVFA
jgi:putative tryptophan/tyrosine transport system substrate-binding protein